MPERIDAILTEHPGYGWEIESPQLPELVGGRETKEALEAELKDLLVFGGASRDAVPALYYQRYLPIDGGDKFAVRVRKDSHVEDRVRVARRIKGALTDKKQLASMSRFPQRSTGEIVFVCAVASDRIDTLTRQLETGGDAIVIAMAVADQMLYTTPVSNEAYTNNRPGWLSLDDVGLGADATVGDLVRYQQTSNNKNLALTV